MGIYSSTTQQFDRVANARSDASKNILVMNHYVDFERCLWRGNREISISRLFYARQFALNIHRSKFLRRTHNDDALVFFESGQEFINV